MSALIWITVLLISPLIVLGWLAILFIVLRFTIDSFLSLRLQNKPMIDQIKHKIEVKTFTDETGQQIEIPRAELKDTVPTGRIRPKTPEEIRKREMNPERREALEEMSRGLDQIPELVAAKEFQRSLRKEEYEGPQHI